MIWSVASIITSPWPLISAIIFIYRCLHLTISCLLFLYLINSFFKVLPLYYGRQRTWGSHPLCWPSAIYTTRFWFFEKGWWSLLDFLVHTVIISGVNIHRREHISIYFIRGSWEANSMLSLSTRVPFLFFNTFNLTLLFSFSKFLWRVYTVVVRVKLELLVHCCFHELGIDIGEQASPIIFIWKIVLCHDLLHSKPLMYSFFTYFCSTPLT